ncbi:MAG: GNAT family N-acetyltransferase [Xanthomonadales bacterium]|nr:GNAT family N-acetyltransferase [Xanthomonadales bacterium]
MTGTLLSVAAALRAALPEGWRLRDEDAGDADIAFLSRLYASSREDELAAVPWSDSDKAGFLDEQFHLQRQHYRMHYAEAGFWVIECAGVPCGRVYVFESPSEYRLMDIALLPEQRGQGVGAALVGALLALAETARRSVTLHVEPNNPANRLYRRLGFNFVEDRGAYRFLRWSSSPIDCPAS